MSGPVPLLIVGGAGRMGRAILEAAARDPGVTVRAALVRAGDPRELPGAPAVYTDLAAASAAVPGGVAIDLSSPAGAAERIRGLTDRGHPLVEGTTGLDETARAALVDGSSRVAVVTAPNLSLGIALVRRALRALVPSVPPDWEISLRERHHRGKKDAPSGTALLLAGEIERLRPPGAPPVPVASLREGEVIGEHEIRCASADEELTVFHRALSRSLFARGALAAARFAATASPGHYGIDDVLG